MPRLQVHQLGNAVYFTVPDSLLGLQQAAAYWRGRQNARVIAITGSVGKTTSKEVIAAVIGQRFPTLRSKGNYNNEIGLPLTLLHLSSSHQRVVLEMGMYDLGEIAQLAEIARPQIGIVTNVGPVHLERLGSIERIAQAKAELPQALPPANQGGVAILNLDDPWVRNMSTQTQARIFTYGLDPSADLWADEIQSEGLEGIYFRFRYQSAKIHARLPMLGRHSVHTALRAAAAGLVEGLSWEEILAGLRDQSAQLRLMAVNGPHGSIILDDTYNSSPESCLAALGLLDELEGRKIAVLGDMYELGRYEEEGHKLVGRRSREVADQLVTIGQLGRTIGEEAIRGGMPTECVHLVETNIQAVHVIKALIETGEGNDRVLVKGSRGMAMEEIVAVLTRSQRDVERQSKESQL
jgi:UDP-N-acetylmuramoyl-tripeptide--D-alanyl-D-alanine ligase